MSEADDKIQIHNLTTHADNNFRMAAFEAHTHEYPFEGELRAEIAALREEIALLRAVESEEEAITEEVEEQTEEVEEELETVEPDLEPISEHFLTRRIGRRDR